MKAKKQKVAWNELFFRFIVIGSLLVGLYIAASFLQAWHDDQKPLQTIYPIYQDEYAVCYRMTQGYDNEERYHLEAHFCVPIR